jgi:hypothetical protein
MSVKFDMKLVIDPVTTPLLHAQLSAAGSARERAALLRALAESALRSAGDYRTADPRMTRALYVDTSWRLDNSGAEDRHVSGPSLRAVSGNPAVPERITPSNDGGIVAHDSEDIGDQFAAFY